MALSCDLLIIGSGFAGTVAAARAAQYGLSVFRTGSPSQMYFASGAMDVLGVLPGQDGNITTPGDHWELLKKQIPGHPYAKASWSQVETAMDFVCDLLAKGGLQYQGRGGENTLIPTALGTFKPSFRIPSTMAAAGDLMAPDSSDSFGGRLLLVDFAGLRGFSAGQMASGLISLFPDRFCLEGNSSNQGASQWQIRTRRIQVPDTQGNLDPVHLANRFEDEDFIQFIKASLATDAADLIGFPPVCGMGSADRILSMLKEELETPVFEIPMMPPSVPGMRMKNAFENALAGTSAQYLGPVKVTKPSGDRFHTQDGFCMEAHSQSGVEKIVSKGLILASGRFPGGGLSGERSGVKESVLDLPVSQPQGRENWHRTKFFHPHGHGINRAGIETNGNFSPVDETGQPLFPNLYAVGSILAHNDWPRMKSGSGVSALSAVTAVDDFYHSLTKGGDRA